MTAAALGGDTTTKKLKLSDWTEAWVLSCFADSADRATGKGMWTGLKPEKHSAFESTCRYAIARAARQLELECAAFTRPGLLPALRGPATAPRRYPGPRGLTCRLAQRDETWELAVRAEGEWAWRWLFRGTETDV